MQIITASEFSSVHLENPIDGNDCADVADFEAAYAEASNSEEFDAKTRRVFGFISAICGFHFKPEDKVEPFANKWAMDGKRSLMGSDLEKPQVDELAAAFSSFRNPGLRARIADLIWVRDKTRSQFARTAIDCYCDLADGLLAGHLTERFERNSATGIGIEKLLRRSAVIASRTGWNKPENDRLRALMLEVLRKSKDSENQIDLVRFGRLASDFSVERTDSLLSDLDQRAATQAEQKKFNEAESLQQLSILIAKRSRNEALIRAGSLALVSILEQKSYASEGAFLKTHALQEAINALDGLKDVREIRQRLHDNLTTSQLHMYEEFGQFEHKIDLTDEVERITRHIESLDFFGLIEALAYSSMPETREKLLQDARDQAQKFPLSSMFPTSIVDTKGRTVGKVAGSVDSADDERARYQVIQSEGLRMGLAVTASIGPIRQFISDNFVVDLDVMIRICEASPFVPSGLEVNFARGLQAFIAGDDPIASSLLVPNLEAGLRAMVEMAGRANTKIVTGGFEQLIGLGPMFERHEDVLKQVFGEALVFCIENLFIHEHGPKVRHNICHGTVSYGALYSAEYVYGSKIIFALVLLPLLLSPDWKDIKTQIIETTSLRYWISENVTVTK